MKVFGVRCSGAHWSLVGSVLHTYTFALLHALLEVVLIENDGVRPGARWWVWGHYILQIYTFALLCRNWY